MTKDEVRKVLFENANQKYKAFNEKLIPNETNIIGVNMPILRQIAKEIAKGDYQAFFADHYEFYHEECTILGCVLQYVDESFENVLQLFDKWLNCVRNWAICDIGVSKIKQFHKTENKEILLNYLLNKLNSTSQPFIRRACIVSIFYYFIDGCNDEKVAQIFLNLKVNTYYEMMALAWGVAELVTKNYPLGSALIESKKLDAATQNKAISKCCDSFKIDFDRKKHLKTFRK